MNDYSLICEKNNDKVINNSANTRVPNYKHFFLPKYFNTLIHKNEPTIAKELTKIGNIFYINGKICPITSPENDTITPIPTI